MGLIFSKFYDDLQFLNIPPFKFFPSRKTSETSIVTNVGLSLSDKDEYFNKNRLKLSRSSSHYQPDLINPLLTDNSRDSYDFILAEILMRPEIHHGTQVENQGSWTTKQWSGYNNRKNWKKDLGFLSFGAVNTKGRDVFPIERVSGAMCKRELSDPGNRIPNQNRNRANINQAQNGNGNAGRNVRRDPVAGGESGGNVRDAIAAGGDGGGGGGANNGQSQTMVIYRYVLDSQNLQITLEQQIETYIIANNCQSWDNLAENIIEIWIQLQRGLVPELDHVTPANCWESAETIFGSRSNGLFQSLNWRTFDNFGAIKRNLNCLLVIENVNDGVNLDRLFGNGTIIFFLYDFLHREMRINYVDFLVEVSDHAFQSWMDVSREVYRKFQERHADFALEIQPEDLDAGKCWVGADTIFGSWSERFQSLNWPTNNWENVGTLINCVILIQYLHD